MLNLQEYIMHLPDEQGDVKIIDRDRQRINWIYKKEIPKVIEHLKACKEYNDNRATQEYDYVSLPDFFKSASSSTPLRSEDLYIRVRKADVPDDSSDVNKGI